MLDIGAMELFVVAVLALVVVGPQELPKLLRTVGGFMRKARELAAEFRSGVEDLAAEVEREVDPFRDLREEEGLRPGMSPGEITDHIMSNREADMVDEAAKLDAGDEKSTGKTEKSEEKTAKIESNSVKSEKKSAKFDPSGAKTEFLEGQHDMFGAEGNLPAGAAKDQATVAPKKAGKKTQASTSKNETPKTSGSKSSAKKNSTKKSDPQKEPVNKIQTTAKTAPKSSANIKTASKKQAQAKQVKTNKGDQA